jgi:hypothetical protein
VPTQEYRNAKGERIPGNTTVISQNLGWSKQPLLYWAWKQGKDGKDFRETRDFAADAGTLAHAMIEADIKNLPPPDTSKYAPEIVEKAETGYLNFMEWKLGIRLVLLTMEVPVVSEKYQYGTTIDIVARANARTCIIECKTSNNIYDEYLIQLSAQKQAWDENHPDDPICGMHVLKVNKESGAFQHNFWESLPGAFEAFRDLRDLHDRKKQLKALM